jgi:AcrR family transcriptional regulator
LTLARVLKEYDERKNEILDAAQELFYSRGYEQTPVNSIIEKVGVSKGTFYHYFKSKEDLLDSLAERVTEQIVVHIEKMLDKPQLGAIAKLNLMFESSAGWKAANREIIIALMNAMYSDNNLLMRKKITARTVAVASPLMTRIIQQGISEGVFNTSFPDDISEMIFQMTTGFSEKFAELFPTLEEHPENKTLIIKTLEMYEDAIERFLGAPSGSIKLGSRAALEKIIG